MKILAINAGSSSIKYQLLDMTEERILAKGKCERIGIDGFIIHKTAKGDIYESEINLATHLEAFQEIIKLLSTGKYSVISRLNEISAVGHRIVFGGEKFIVPMLLSDEILCEIESISDLAPLHNPPILQTIRDCRYILGDSTPQVGVFDTAFHITIPEKAYTYAIPLELAEKYNIRRYGYHGISLEYVCSRLVEISNKSLSEMKVIVCHLGNGVSITAVNKGKSIDTSMGFTPLSGVIMGTRCGDIDPGIISLLQQKENLSSNEIDDILNKKSGLLGISGITSNPFDLKKAVANGDERAKLALEIQSYQAKKYIGAYAAIMGGLNAVVFTGGLGEGSASTRARILDNMGFLGIELDDSANKNCGGVEMEITKKSSKIKVYVIPTDEELLIARYTMKVINELQK
jgi:acetate kinase